MKAYSVHAPPDAPADAERFAFVKEGFSWPALFVPVLFILWHRMWLTLIWYAVFVLGIAWIDRLNGDTNAIIVGFLGGLLFALEANNFRRLSLQSRGWSEIGGAFGRNLEEAEIRFFEDWAARSAAPAAKGEAMGRAAHTPQARARGAEEPILGLFPEPER